GHLTLEEIIKLRLPTAEFAFLSACQTTAGDEKLSEEAVHIAGAMLLAGYRGVVATMWSIRDDLAPEVADAFYAYLTREGKRPDNRKAAEALHFAMKQLRERPGVSLLDWLPFVHLATMSPFLPSPAEFFAAVESSSPNSPVPSNNELGAAQASQADIEQAAHLDFHTHPSHVSESLSSIKESDNMNGLEPHNSTESVRALLHTTIISLTCTLQISNSFSSGMANSSTCAEDGDNSNASSSHLLSNSSSQLLPRKRSRRDIAEEDASIDESIEKMQLREFARSLAAEGGLDEEKTEDLVSFME
ncbi:4792_t:CDS:2, partial [Acaulospora colombiana]